MIADAFQPLPSTLAMISDDFQSSSRTEVRDHGGPPPGDHGGPPPGGRGRVGAAGRTRRAGVLAQASRGEPDGEPADPEAVARLVCLRLLAAAPRTRAQLAVALRRRHVPEEAAAAVLSRFADVGLIDDAMFANAWVESRHHGRGLARRALAAELGRRGVDGADIQAAVARLSPETELATARALVERRLASTHGPPARAEARKLIGMLARKGYSPAVAYRVVREALEQIGQDYDLGEPDDDEFEPAMDDNEPA